MLATVMILTDNFNKVLQLLIAKTHDNIYTAFLIITVFPISAITISKAPLYD